MAFFDQLAADEYGTADDRRPVLLLHGLSYDRRQWEPFVRHLGDGHRVLAVDLPGHGESPRRGSYHAVEVADALHAAVSAAGLKDPVVVGHSLGGVLATVYAARHPVTAVVDVDQPLHPGGFAAMLREVEPVLRGPDWREVWDRLVGGMHLELLPPEMRELVETRTDPRPDILLGYWDELLIRPAEQIAEERADELRIIAGHGYPYLFVAGREPRPEYARWLTGSVPDAEIVVLAGSGHFPHLAHPAELAAVVSRLARP